MTVTRGRSRGQTAAARIKAQPTTRVTARFTIALPPCHHGQQHPTREEALGCAIARKLMASNAVGGGIQANLVGINERLMALGASDVMEWEVE